jgi:hypothetical protein
LQEISVDFKGFSDFGLIPILGFEVGLEIGICDSLAHPTLD